jgi:hypothetical protein
LVQAVQDLLAKQAIVQVKDYQSDPGFYSPYFLAAKKDGSLRPILNLKNFNKFLVKEKFRMETLRSILQTLQLDDWLYSLDLKDAYLHVPIHVKHRKYLRFAYLDDQGQTLVFQWNVLPFGLSSSPRVFTKLLIPVVKHLHKQGHRLNPYLDDLIGAATSFALAKVGENLLTDTLMALGYIINVAKSHLEPCKELIHLGALIQTHSGTVSVPRDKAMGISHQAQALQGMKQTTAVQFLSFIGRVVACQDMIVWCMYHVRPLIVFLASQYVPLRDSLKKVINLDQDLISESLAFWADPVNILRGREFTGPQAYHVITTDASDTAYGAWSGDQTLSGWWDANWLQTHINLKEMQAVFLALQAFQASLSPGQVVVQTDNATVMAYLRHQGGIHSPQLDEVTRRVIRWCMGRNLTLWAVHIAGADNTLADKLSRPNQVLTRDLFKSVEWELSQSIANLIFTHWGTPWVDLFATRANRKVPTFCSRVPDPLALKADPMTMNWSQGLLYAYPPLSFILQVLAKARREEAEVIAILPWWPARGWFPLVLDLLVDLPILLPLQPDLLVNPAGESYPSLSTLHLAVWRLSGKRYKQEEFLRKLPQLLANPSEIALKHYTTRSGNVLFAGARNAISIPFTAL